MLYATEDHESNGCILRGEEYHGIVPCLCNPFSVPMAWTTMLINCNYLGLSGDAVDTFLDIITEHRTNVMTKLLGVLKEHDVVEGKIVYGFPFVIGSNIGWESIC